MTEVMSRCGVRADLFGLELTASTLPDEAEVAIVKMTELKARGLSFPKDHFGARNSSLADLKRLPLDEPETDRRFVLDVLNGPDDATTVRTILALPFSLEQVAKGRIEAEASTSSCDGMDAQNFRATFSVTWCRCTCSP